MANYWVKTPESGAVRGPFSGSQLKAMALNGELAGSELVSVDQTKWSPAERVKGLFPAAVESPPGPQKSVPPHPPALPKIKTPPQPQVQTTAAAEVPAPSAPPPEPLPPENGSGRMPRRGLIIAGVAALVLLAVMTPAIISQVNSKKKAPVHTEAKETEKRKEKNAHQSSHADAESPATPPAPVAPASANSGPPLSDETNGLLALTDPASQTRSGKWFVQNRALSSRGVGTEVIGIPALLPAEFDLTMDFVRLTGDEDIAVQVKSGEIHFMLLIGASHNTRMGVDLPGKKRLSASPEAFKGKNLILPTVPQELVLKVRNGSVQATLNGTQTYSITADRGSWTVPTNWQAAKNDTLAVGTRNSSVEFHSLRVVPAPAE